LSKVERVDVVRGQMRIPDVPFDRSGFVRLLTSGDLIRAVPTMKIPFQLVAVDAAGRDRTLGEYTLDHTAYAP
jgi:hypothetical protein